MYIIREKENKTITPIIIDRKETIIKSLDLPDDIINEEILSNDILMLKLHLLSKIKKSNTELSDKISKVNSDIIGRLSIDKININNLLTNTKETIKGQLSDTKTSVSIRIDNVVKSIDDFQLKFVESIHIINQTFDEIREYNKRNEAVINYNKILTDKETKRLDNIKINTEDFDRSMENLVRQIGSITDRIEIMINEQNIEIKKYSDEKDKELKKVIFTKIWQEIKAFKGEISHSENKIKEKINHNKKNIEKKLDETNIRVKNLKQNQKEDKNKLSNDIEQSNIDLNKLLTSIKSSFDKDIHNMSSETKSLIDRLYDSISEKYYRIEDKLKDFITPDDISSYIPVSKESPTKIINIKARDGINGIDGKDGKDGKSIDGKDGKDGRTPKHQIESNFNGFQLRFENPDGTWGQWIVIHSGAGGGDSISGNVGGSTLINEFFTLSSTDITNKYITLAYVPDIMSSIIMEISGAPQQLLNVDYEVSDSNSYRITWEGFGMENILEIGEKINMNYSRV